MWSLLSIVLAVFSFLPSSLALNCSIPPVYVDIHMRAVHGTGVFQYGSFLGMGTPAQNLSLWPSLTQNETSVAADEFCDHSKLENCRDSTGGIVDVSQSTSWQQDNDYQSADLTDTAFNESFGGSDVLEMYTHYFRTDPAWQTLLPNYTFTMATDGEVNPGILGMGQRSTILQHLFDAGMISGHVYSLYIGNSFNRSGGEAIGSNTFGGYDPQRFVGDVYSSNMTLGAANPLKVRVSDIILDDPTGFTRNVSLLDQQAFPNLGDSNGSSGFDAQITTEQFPFALPYEVVQNYKKQLGAVASEYPDGSLQLAKPFNGTMTVVLDNGFRVAMPPEMMFNVSGISPVADRREDDGSPFLLGSAWLTQVYLMMDYEDYTFHLAQAIPLPDFNQPKTWCPRTVPEPAQEQKGGSGFARNGLIGAVLGGVIGGLALIALAVWLYVWWARRSLMKAESRRMSDDVEMTKADFEQVPSEVGGYKEEGDRTRLWRT